MSEDNIGIRLNWREKCVIRILLVIACIITDNSKLHAELVAMSNHIAVHG